MWPSKHSRSYFSFAVVSEWFKWRSDGCYHDLVRHWWTGPYQPTVLSSIWISQESPCIGADRSAVARYNQNVSSTDSVAEECLDKTSSTICEGLFDVAVCVSQTSSRVIVPLVLYYVVQELHTWCLLPSADGNPSVGFACLQELTIGHSSSYLSFVHLLINLLWFTNSNTC